ncbi:MAG TPA: hypothetical protein PK668_18810 [Myxococcota bacterium]|nr:hypothetical protein [Myxococcota bacterium]HRY96604.1 hypothetical protein [Myxococcota bacterium]
MTKRVIDEEGTLRTADDLLRRIGELEHIAEVGFKAILDWKARDFFISRCQQLRRDLTIHRGEFLKAEPWRFPNDCLDRHMLAELHAHKRRCAEEIDSIRECVIELEKTVEEMLQRVVDGKGEEKKALWSTLKAVNQRMSFSPNAWAMGDFDYANEI